MPAETDVLVVGAGLAGLATAVRLTRAGRSVRVLEAAAAPGGRMRTDVVDGFRVDRGFQVLNTAYPALQALDVLDRLTVQRFVRGAVLVRGSDRHRVVDPRREPGAVGSDLTAPLGSLRERATLAAFVAECAYASAGRIRNRRDVEFGEQLSRWRLDGAPTDRFLRPFLSGVLLESGLTTSARFVDFVLRTFVRGDVVVPAAGMQALPDSLAAMLPDATVSYDTKVHAVRPGEVDSEAGTLRARAVVVAADPVTASDLLDLPRPGMHGVTTVWHVADRAPATEPLLVLDADGGPVANTVVLSNAAPGYSPDSRALVATSYLGPRLPDDRLRAELRRLWATPDVAAWEELAVSEVPAALPALPGGSPLRRAVRLADGLFVAGDWRDTPSTQGALVSGRRAADAVLAAR